MTYVVAATWVAKPGSGDRVAEILQMMLEPSRAEPGCRGYWAHRSVEDENTFFLYEIYDDPEAYEAHTDTPHFTRHVSGEAVHHLERRERQFFEPLEPFA
jgi:quinol monooxygenase YgiN